ncbi:MAG: glutathione S-transferase family protein [Sphingomonas sp.]
MGVRLYGVAGSPNVRGAMLGLAEKGVDYELIPVLPADFKAPEQLALNPFGRVPVLKHDGFVLYETQAILRYIDEAFEGPALVPATASESARMNQILGIIDCHLFPTWSGTIGIERLIAPKFFGRPSDIEQIEAAVPLARTCAEALEAVVAAPYLTGETFGLADIRLIPHFDWFRLTPEGAVILADKRKLTRWFQRVSERPTVKRIMQL